MTSVLYSAGLNYQAGNPVRQEILSVRREVDSLRKQMDALTEENQVYRKYLIKLLSNLPDDDGKMQAEFTSDLMKLSTASTSASASASSSQPPQLMGSNNSGGNYAFQGNGIRR
mgnify:CR=1 FL=1